MAAAPVPLIPSLYNTGTDNAYDLLGDCDADPHYGDVAYQNGVFPLNGTWINNTLVARWISRVCSGGTDEGDYIYTLSFVIPPSAAVRSIQGRFAVDNIITDILLNGISIGDISQGGFNFWTEFTLEAGLIVGTNTVTFETYNEAIWQGLILEWTGADIQTPGPPPGVCGEAMGGMQGEVGLAGAATVGSQCVGGCGGPRMAARLDAGYGSQSYCPVGTPPDPCAGIPDSGCGNCDPCCGSRGISGS